MALSLILALALGQILTEQEVAAQVADKATLGALTDGNGHFIVYKKSDVMHGGVFYGDGKTFYILSVFGGGMNGTEAWDVSFWEPRFDRSAHGGYATVSMHDSGAQYSVDCGTKTTSLKPVTGDALKTLLDGAKFLPQRWTRMPHQLLRDDTGVYYFVDRLRDQKQHRDFRVFMGPRGKLTQLPLKDIVDDSKGTIYATKSGNLRLVANSSNYTWVSGKQTVKLIDVPIEENGRMIYLDLGPYSGALLGTPCDDLM